MGLKEFTNTWYNIKKPVLSDYFVSNVFKSMIFDSDSIYFSKPRRTDFSSVVKF